MAKFNPAAVSSSLDFFGFLPERIDIQFSGGSVQSLFDLDARVATFREMSNTDGFVYPPVQRRQRMDMQDFVSKHKQLGRIPADDEVSWTDVPRTSRPALLHRLAPSHQFSVDPSRDEPLRESSGAFLMNLIGYAYGYRLQFFDWWFDGRVNAKPKHNIFIRQETVGQLAGFALDQWRSWPGPDQKRFTNLLYMLNRAPSYEWPWEQFTIEYMVLDALYKTAGDLRQWRRRPHKDRLRHLADELGIQFHETEAAEIVTLRNNLFHESLWASGQPCNADSDAAWSARLNVRKICQRLVPAVLGFRTDYVRTDWRSLGAHAF